MSEIKIWYSYENLISGPLTRDILYITKDNFNQFESLVKETIDTFNKHVKYPEMWNLEDAKFRLKNNQSLFIGYDRQGALAHVWFDKDYLYNCFVNPRRPEGYGVTFITKCLQSVPHRKIRLYCDEWNIKAQKFFEKVGFKKTISYI